MTRKHFRALAEALRACRPDVIPGTNVIPDDTARKVWYQACSEVSKVCARENSLFNASKFFDACGVPD
jgi:hypothetical protein